MFRTIITTLATSTLPAVALAGTISGGGGQLQRYEGNPWFLDNVSVVRYCVEQDQTAFHLDPAVARGRIDQAIAHLQDFFRQWESNIPNANAKFRVATQAFSYQDKCDATTDLRFQLGTVTAGQRASLGDPSQWAGVAVIEAYDFASLRARGFIYLGADAGTDAMRDPEGVGDLPWQPCAGLPFEQVVLHELGHVFGLRHNELSTVMREYEPQSSVSKAYVDAIRNYPEACAPSEAYLNDDLFYARGLVPDGQFAVDSPAALGTTKDARLVISDHWNHLHFDVDGGAVLDLRGSYAPVPLVMVTIPPQNPAYQDGNLFAYPSVADGVWHGTWQLGSQSVPVQAYTGNDYLSLQLASYDPKSNTVDAGYVVYSHPSKVSARTLLPQAIRRRRPVPFRDALSP